MKRTYAKPQVVSEERLEQTSLACTIIPDLLEYDDQVCYPIPNSTLNDVLSCQFVVTKDNTFVGSQCSGGGTTPMPTEGCIAAQQFS